MQPSLRQFIDERRQAALKEANQVKDQDLMYGDLNEIAMQLAARHRLDTPRFGKPSVDAPKAVTLSADDVQRMPEAFSLALWPGRASYPGVRVTVRVPFEGHPELFKYQPSSFNMSRHCSSNEPENRGFTRPFMGTLANAG
ncbi:hypothetical protein [Deinococcus arcticus]|uniref:hypothetical protein n=1 Tax=Deinococcus arcticus TaxID=2136176 RepID=UPI001304D644|nr:hypothetical protein [Deinococcus arcticus]